MSKGTAGGISRPALTATVIGWTLALAPLAGCKNDGPPRTDAPAVSEAPPSAGVAPTHPASAGDGITLAAAHPTPGLEDESPIAEPMDAAPELALADAPPAVVNEGPHNVLILGDSLAATGFGALLEKRLDEHPDIVCHRKGKSASGLARPDFFDWMAEAKRQVELRDPALVIVIMGGNDGQDLVGRKGSDVKRVGWNDDAWAAAYRERMDAFLAEISLPERRVLWLELPTMGLRSLEKKLELIRQVQRESVEALGDRGTYLPTAALVTDGEGALLTHAPVGPKGRSEVIRADDRIHFTMSGSQYFADKVYPSVLGVLGIPDAGAAD